MKYITPRTCFNSKASKIYDIKQEESSQSEIRVFGVYD